MVEQQSLGQYLADLVSNLEADKEALGHAKKEESLARQHTTEIENRIIKTKKQISETVGKLGLDKT